MRNATWGPGPGKGYEPLTTASTSPAGSRACAAAPRPAARLGWCSAQPPERLRTRPGAGRGLGLAFAPGGAPAAHTPAYLRAASAPLPAAGTPPPRPGTAQAWRLPLQRPGSAGCARVQPSGEEGAAGAGRETRGGEESSRKRGIGKGGHGKGAGCAPPPPSAWTADPCGLWGTYPVPRIISYCPDFEEAIPL